MMSTLRAGRDLPQELSSGMQSIIIIIQGPEVLEKLVNKFFALYGTRKFIAMLTRTPKFLRTSMHSPPILISHSNTLRHMPNGQFFGLQLMPDTV
jgi:hypothetical protein